MVETAEAFKKAIITAGTDRIRTKKNNTDGTECRIPDYNPDFKDCPNTPHSKNHNGTHCAKSWNEAKEKYLSMTQVEHESTISHFADVI